MSNIGMKENSNVHDYVIIGGGIVGLATAAHLLHMYPQASVAVLEKEAELGMHQTGRNSGVIHSGIYYKPGSLKATYARRGNRAMYEFCKAHGIPFERCGKVIVATERKELPLLDALYRRGQKNGLDVKKLTPEELTEIEPHVRGLAAIYVPSTGIVNYKDVLFALADDVQQRGGEIRRSARVKHIEQQSGHFLIRTTNGNVRAQYLINCAGLFSDRVARMAGATPGVAIVPFRGEYYELRPQKAHLVNHLIYPVPDPAFPFLGVHFTRMIDGTIHIGPNAVLSFGREGYRKRDIRLKDTMEVITNRAFWKIAARHFKTGLGEMVRSFNKRAFTRRLKRFIPDIEPHDLLPAAAGVRAQALTKDGRLLDDFYMIQRERAIHVCNAPSPAATASLLIGQHIAERVRQEN